MSQLEQKKKWSDNKRVYEYFMVCVYIWKMLFIE